jgi:hypothetical protein
MFRRRPDLPGKVLWLVEALALLVLLLCIGNAVVVVVTLLRSVLG